MADDERLVDIASAVAEGSAVDWRAAEEGAKWGAAVGATIGFIFPTERWRRVRLGY